MTVQYACQPFITAAQLAAAPCACSFDEFDDAELLTAVIEQASDILTLISGARIHGVCTVTVRPVGDQVCFPVSDGVIDAWPANPWLVGAVRLRGPLPDVVAVWVDGVALPSSAYRLIDNLWLLRVDGGSWPTYNNLTRTYAQTGTWMIQYRFGRAPDFITREACTELACELASGYMGKETRLPAGVTSANIQGANITMQDRANALAAGADEQIPAISRFVGIYAPDGTARSGVWSPEIAGAWELVEVEGPSGS